MPGARAVRYIMPMASMRRLCERARQEWGERAEESHSPARTTILIWEGGRQHFAGPHRPVSSFVVEWNMPSISQATISSLQWDPDRGGSETEVREVINALAGYPIARDPVAIESIVIPAPAMAHRARWEHLMGRG